MEVRVVLVVVGGELSYSQQRDTKEGAPVTIRTKAPCLFVFLKREQD